MKIEARSSVYYSPAIGPDGLPDGKPPFYNMAAAVATTLTIGELRAVLRRIESEMGRVRVSDKFAPRPIDLDIEFYGRGMASIDSMSVPDSKIGKHAHVILPLAEIAPDWLHPELELTLSEIALRLTESKVEIIKL
jgi:2-amino-4-hydroxy-6-hydroxymethyldihydropteridine diphosphokinase